MIQEEYSGDFFPEFYDLLHRKCIDTKLFAKILKPYGKKVLELGCGTGRIAIPLANADYQVTGIECAPDMIKRFEKKGYDRSKIKIIQGDARDFQLNETFDIILLCNNFINNFIDSLDIIRCLTCCRSHMHSKSVIIIEVSVPEVCYMNGERKIESNLKFVTERGTIVVDQFHASFDILEQIEEDHILIQEIEGDKILRSANAHDLLSWYWPREIRSLVREAKLQIFKETGDLFDEGKANDISLEHESMIFYLKL